MKATESEMRIMEATPTRVEIQLASLRAEIANMFAQKAEKKATVEEMLGYKPYGYETRKL